MSGWPSTPLTSLQMAAPALSLQDVYKRQVWYYGDLLTLNEEPQLYIVPSYFAPELVTARAPESGEEFVILDGGRHGYDNMFCDEHDPSELEYRSLKRYEIPVSYTHLDVYKRQIRWCSDPFEN